MKFKFRHYLPKTFLLRSFLIIVLPVLWIFVVSGTVFLQRHWKYVAGTICQGIAQDVKFLCMLDAKKILPWSRIHTIGDRFFHLRIEKKTFFQFPTIQHAHEDSQSMFLYEALTKAFPLGVRVFRTHSTVASWVQTSDAVYVFYTPTQRLGYRTLRLCGIWASVSSALFLMIAIIIMRQQIRPLRRLSEWFRQVTPDYIPELPRIEGAREIRRIGIGLRRMVQHLQQEFEQRHQFLLDLSHDLRTPLTRMKLQCQFLSPSKDLHALEEDLEHMIHMVNRYLEFTAHIKFQKEKIDFYESICSVRQKNLSNTIPITWKILRRPPYYLQGNHSDLERCIQNLLDNACRFSKKRVEVSIFQNKNCIVVCIQDDGQGIPEFLEHKIFTPFFKGDASRSSYTQGSFGLGLAITERIIKAHQGSVYIAHTKYNASCRALCGAHIHIELPLLENE